MELRIDSVRVLYSTFRLGATKGPRTHHTGLHLLQLPYPKFYVAQVKSRSPTYHGVGRGRDTTHER